MKRTLTIAVGILGLLVFLALSGAFYTVQEGQQAIILQFGKVVGDPVTEAGLHFKIPLVQKVLLFEKRLMIWDGDPEEIPTKGREFIKVDVEGHEDQALASLSYPVDGLNMEFHQDWMPRKAMRHVDGLGRYEWNYCMNNTGTFMAPEWMDEVSIGWR